MEPERLEPWGTSHISSPLGPLGPLGQLGQLGQSDVGKKRCRKVTHDFPLTVPLGPLSDDIAACFGIL